MHQNGHRNYGSGVQILSWVKRVATLPPQKYYAYFQNQIKTFLIYNNLNSMGFH